MKKMLALSLFFVATNPHYILAMQQTLQKDSEVAHQHPRMYSALTHLLTHQPSVIIGKHRTTHQLVEKTTPVLKNTSQKSALPFKKDCLLNSDKLKQKAIRGIMLSLELADQKKRFSGELFDMEME